MLAVKVTREVEKEGLQIGPVVAEHRAHAQAGGAPQPVPRTPPPAGGTGIYQNGQTETHTEFARDTRHALSQRTVAHDAERHRRKLAYREVQHAEVGGALPVTGTHSSTVGSEAVCEREQYAEDVLDDGLRAVMTDVGDADAVLPGAFGIDIVGTGCSECYELKVGACLEQFARQSYLVRENDVHAGDPLCHLLVRRLVEDDELIDQAFEFLQVEAGTHGSEIKEYGFHGKLRYPLTHSRR